MTRGEEEPRMLHSSLVPTPRRGRAGVIARLVVAAVLAVTVAACGGSSSKKSSGQASTPATTPPANTQTALNSTTPSGSVDVSLKEYTVAPTPGVGKAGKLTFTVHNDGQLPHEFVVVSTAQQSGELAEASGGGQKEASEKGKVDEIGDMAPGTRKTLTVNLKAGHYVLLCNLPGHYQAGQHIDFNVQ
jgi:uncharacterized cupredoxin-like copper-binding protein